MSEKHLPNTPAWQRPRTWGAAATLLALIWGLLDFFLIPDVAYVVALNRGPSKLDRVRISWKDFHFSVGVLTVQATESSGSTYGSYTQAWPKEALVQWAYAGRPDQMFDTTVQIPSPMRAWGKDTTELVLEFCDGNVRAFFRIAHSYPYLKGFHTYPEDWKSPENCEAPSQST